jgi:hypothetical protein
VETNVEESLERPTSIVTFTSSLGQSELAVGLLNTLEVLIKLELLQHTTSQEQADSVAGGPVGQTVFDTISLELVGVGRSVDFVAGKLSGHELADDVAVGEADYQSVLGSVVLVLGLGDEALTSIVVGLQHVSLVLPRLEARPTDLTRASALVLGLEAGEVGRVLDTVIVSSALKHGAIGNLQLGERHGCGLVRTNRLFNCTPNQHTADPFRSDMQGFSRTFCQINLDVAVPVV